MILRKFVGRGAKKNLRPQQQLFLFGGTDAKWEFQVNVSESIQ